MSLGSVFGFTYAVAQVEVEVLRTDEDADQHHNPTDLRNHLNPTSNETAARGLRETSSSDKDCSMEAFEDECAASQRLDGLDENNSEDEWKDIDDSDEPNESLRPRTINQQLNSRLPKRRRDSMRRSIFSRNIRQHRSRGPEIRDDRKARSVATNDELHSRTTSKPSTSREASPARSIRWKDIETSRAAERTRRIGDDSHKVQFSLPP